MPAAVHWVRPSASYALTLVTRQIVRAHEPKIKGLNYICPDPACSGEVVPHQGKKLAWHFTHKAPCLGTGESVEHHTAKHIIIRQINDWLDCHSMSIPVFERTATLDMTSHAWHTLWATAIRAKPEVTLDCGLRPDIWAGFAIEICHTHAVDEAKAARYKAAGISWVELDAAPVLDGRWVLLAYGCAKCGNHGRSRELPDFQCRQCWEITP